MITIISGTPGSGKTALIVDMMMDELKRGRKIFTIGIPKLLLNVHEGGDSHEWQEGTWLKIDKYDPALTKAKGIKSTWFPRGCSESCQFLSTCPRYSHDSPDAGALIIIDESHTDFPQRSSGKAPPAYVEALTVHRHQGLDFWFVTQRPSFLDPFIRGLSSRHIHISLNPFSFVGNRNRYEWSEYQETVNRTSKLLAAKSDYKPSPAVFPLYASASLHTKLDQRMPTIMKAFLFVIVLILLAVGFGAWRVKARMDAINHPLPLASGQIVQTAPSAGGQRSGHTDGGAAASSVVAASAVDAVAVVQPDLMISACLASEKTCQCYTDRGIKLPLPESVCRESAKSPNTRFKFKDQDNQLVALAKNTSLRPVSEGLLDAPVAQNLPPNRTRLLN